MIRGPVRALGVVALVCVGARVVGAIVAPVLPTAVSLFVLVAVTYWLLLSFGVRRG